MQQQRHDGRVDSAGETADNLSLPYLLLDRSGGIINKRAHGPVAATAGGIEEKVTK